MKDKILLEICLPAAGRSFDVRIPGQLKVTQAADLLVEFLKGRVEEFIPTDESVLCDMETGKALDPNAFIGTAGLHNGSRVMLV